MVFAGSSNTLIAKYYIVVFQGKCFDDLQNYLLNNMREMV